MVINGTDSEWKEIHSGVPQGSVLGPVLFLIYINDLPDALVNDIYMFADDTKLSLQNAEQEGCASLQRDLDCIDDWSTTWQLKFNISKCKTMHLGHHNIRQTYQMGQGNERTNLLQVSSEKDLGVTFQDDLQFSQHIADKVKKANSMLGLVRRSFKFMNIEMFMTLYKSLIRPQLEYASCVWSPYKVKELRLIEGVQRRATLLVPGIKTLTYDQRLRHLGLPTLEYRRYRADMQQVFKIMNGLEDLPHSQFFSASETGLRGHTKKLYKEQNRLNIRKMSFTQRIVDKWNQLPENVVSAPSINAFKSRFNTFTEHNPNKFCPPWY